MKKMNEELVNSFMEEQMELEEKRKLLLKVEDFGRRTNMDRWYPMPLIDTDRLLLDDGYEHAGREAAMKEICFAANLQRAINYGEDVDKVCLMLEKELQPLVDRYNSAIAESCRSKEDVWTEYDSCAKKLLKMAAAIRNTCVERGLLPEEMELAAGFLIRTHRISDDPIWYPFRGGFESDYRALKHYLSKFRLEPRLEYLDAEAKAISNSCELAGCYERALENLSHSLRDGVLIDRAMWFSFQKLVCWMNDEAPLPVIRNSLGILREKLQM